MTVGNEFEENRERAARAERDKELGLPNFTALREWIDKLEDWCREEAEDRQKAERSAKDMQDQVEAQERELVLARDATEELESVEEQLQDVERGVVTFEEFMERRRRAAIY